MPGYVIKDPNGEWLEIGIDVRGFNVVAALRCFLSREESQGKVKSGPRSAALLAFSSHSQCLRQARKMLVSFRGLLGPWPWGALVWALSR